MFETIVLATDGSASAERAVTLALDFAETFDADLHVCYVVEDREDAERPHEALRSEGEKTLEAIEGRAQNVTTELREGDATEEICAYAEEIDSDLIVTGTRGRHGEHAFLLGSVAESVVRESPAPVLTARQLSEEAPPNVPVSGGN